MTTRGRWNSLLRTTTASHCLLYSCLQNPATRPHRSPFTPTCPSPPPVSTDHWPHRTHSCCNHSVIFQTLICFSFRLYDADAGRSRWRLTSDCISSGSSHDPYTSPLHPHTWTPTDPRPTPASTQPEWLQQLQTLPDARLLSQWVKHHVLTNHNATSNKSVCVNLSFDQCYKNHVYMYMYDIEERTDVTSFRTKSGQNEVHFVFVLGVWNGLPKSNFPEKFIPAAKHLRSTIGPWPLRHRRCVLRPRKRFFHVELFSGFIISPVESLEVRCPQVKTWTQWKASFIA